MHRALFLIELEFKKYIYVSLPEIFGWALFPAWKKQNVLNMNCFTLGFMPREKYQILKYSDKNPCLLLNKSMQSQVNWPKSSEWLTTHIEITISSRT